MFKQNLQIVYLFDLLSGFKWYFETCCHHLLVRTHFTNHQMPHSNYSFCVGLIVSVLSLGFY